MNQAHIGKLMMDSTALTLDVTDYRILRALTDDGRASDVTIGEKINLSSTAVARRRKILEDRGIITGYDARIDLSKLGFSGTALVSVELVSQSESVLVEFERAVRKCPSISYCGFISGEADFIMLLHVSSLDEYDKVYRREISILPHVAKIKSSFVLREISRHKTPVIVLGT
jgi:Lrp/AsnC family transcriptional regulator, leucine-responsive regulatory protein